MHHAVLNALSTRQRAFGAILLIVALGLPAVSHAIIEAHPGPFAETVVEGADPDIRSMDTYFDVSGAMTAIVYTVLTDNDLVATASWDVDGDSLVLNYHGVGEAIIRVDGYTSDSDDHVLIEVTVLADEPAGIEQELEDLTVKINSGPVGISLEDAFSSPGGSPLTYDVELSNDSLAHWEINGEILTLTPATDEQGQSTVTVTAKRGSHSTPQSFEYTVYNSEPQVVSPIGSVSLIEGGESATFNLDDVFDDPDLVEGDHLTYTVDDVVLVERQPWMADNVADFLAVTVSGSTLELVPQNGRFGELSVSIRADDKHGGSVVDTFTVVIEPSSGTLNAVDDGPIIVQENSDPVTIDVLANDERRPDEPLTIVSAGTTQTVPDPENSEGTIDIPNSTDSDPTSMIDDADNIRTEVNGLVEIVDGQIVYTPKQYFHGSDTFSYTVENSTGERSTATVHLTVEFVGNPPVGRQLRTYDTRLGDTLVVRPSDGVFVGVFDPDGAHLDEDGNPIGGTDLFVVQGTGDIFTEHGTVTWHEDGDTGGFTYTPHMGSTYVGFDLFTYRLSDGTHLSEEHYTVEIHVREPLQPPAPATPGFVENPYDLSQAPLEQVPAVPPNVLMVLDDSGSMDWNLLVDMGINHGMYFLSNSASISRINHLEWMVYSYLYDLPVNNYHSNADAGRILPTEASLAANHAGNNYGVWRARTHKFNHVYYNPAVRYRPWVGLDLDNNEFTDANPEAVRLDPRTSTHCYNNAGNLLTSRCIDITQNHTYTSYRVPNWGGNGRSNLSVSEYIPHYYTTPVVPDPENPLPHNAPNTRVDIVANGGPYAGGMFRTDCIDADSDEMTCTYEQELQNFANWFQYYRTRMHLTKAAIGSVVAGAQDLRIGYKTINLPGGQGSGGNESGGGTGAVAPRSFVDIRHMNDDFRYGNKHELMDSLYAVEPAGSTPLRMALERAGRVFTSSIPSTSISRYTHFEDPVLPAPQGTCQQNFTLLFSDGYWDDNWSTGPNGLPAGDYDANTTNPFDGGRYADGFSNTLADIAMFYYKTDLRPELDNEVPVGSRDAAYAPSTAFPGDRPRMHQHMKTYTIAFGLRGTIEPEDVVQVPLADTIAWTDPHSSHAHKLDDMVHASMNGRGTHVSANNPEELRRAFEAAFLEFAQARSSVTSVAFNSTALQEDTLLFRGFFDLRDSTGDLTATTVNSDGSLASLPEWSAADVLDDKNPNTRVIITFDAQEGHGIPFRYGELNANQQAELSEFQVDYLRGDRDQEWPLGNLRSRRAELGMLGDIANSSPVFVGRPRAVNRDQRPYPVSNLYSSFSRDEADRTPIVYVGANDGMLHGFRATDGEEVFAFVPNMIIDSTKTHRNSLADYTSPFYSHRYFVDLTPRVNDVYMRPYPGTLASQRQWNTVLVGGLGAGGKGYFALNVTDPSRYAEVNADELVLWEFTDADDSYPTDSTGSPLTDADGNTLRDEHDLPIRDLGYAIGETSTGMSNMIRDDEREWVTIFGNGYNSTAGFAKLFVLLMDRGLDGWEEWGPNDTSGSFVKIDTGVGPATTETYEARANFPNGLGEPLAVDIDRNGTIDLVYAGDLLGNMYRFDLRCGNPNGISGECSAWSATRLFTATDPNGDPQPITQRPTVVRHPDDDPSASPTFIVMFGTGSLVTTEDAKSEQIQSVYGIWDRMQSVPETAGLERGTNRLVKQVVTNVPHTVTLPSGETEQQTRRVMSRYPVDYLEDDIEEGLPHLGWFFDLDPPAADGSNPGEPQFPGEQAIRRFIIRDDTVITTTVLPSQGEFSCFGARPGALMLWDTATGGNPRQQILDFNRDGIIDEDDLVSVGDYAFAAGILFDDADFGGALVSPSTLTGSNYDYLFVSGGGDTDSYGLEQLDHGKTGRLSWREMEE